MVEEVMWDGPRTYPPAQPAIVVAPGLYIFVDYHVRIFIWSAQRSSAFANGCFCGAYYQPRYFNKLEEIFIIYDFLFSFRFHSLPHHTQRAHQQCVKAITAVFFLFFISCVWFTIESFVQAG